MIQWPDDECRSLHSFFCPLLTGRESNTAVLSEIYFQIGIAIEVYDIFIFTKTHIYIVEVEPENSYPNAKKKKTKKQVSIGVSYRVLRRWGHYGRCSGSPPLLALFCCAIILVQMVLLDVMDDRHGDEVANTHLTTQE